MPSFDVVSTVDMQEVANALQQARREVEQRYDFKGSNTEIEQDDEGIKITSSDDYKVTAVVDVLQTKLLKRGVDLKFLEYEKAEPAAGGRARQVVRIQQGLDKEAAKEVVKAIKAEKLKVQAQVQDDQVRVTGKKRDELQSVMALLKGLDFRRPLQFVNLRD
ncbi:MAG: YajQ family cyclic di-GMP-binding protein [Candidatus Binatia bacterium]|nr:YajQ family cyclic di-GMP-binding protein [Candidatus Binatia bacterium]MDG1957790.1 YajQ family cyclic di-GMP-binding protein [Candidatus Binatia bacterium]MDG2008767.1 YajQ family cyclic di-GMP-binding protein [Candidatus Binatia bacterium]HAC79827.1 YajQ family cyclic di-GMP-binding protein [Deltaproteobacteria bacterium]